MGRGGGGGPGGRLTDPEGHLTWISGSICSLRRVVVDLLAWSDRSLRRLKFEKKMIWFLILSN